MLVTILLSLVPMFGFGIANSIQKDVIKYMSSAQLILIRGIFVSLITGSMLLFSSLTESEQALGAFDPVWVLLAIGLSAVSYFGLYFFNRALESGNLSIVAPISSTRILLTSGISLLLLGERLSVGQILMVFMIFLGIVLASVNLKNLRSSDIFNKKSGLYYALLAALFWGGTFAFFGVFSSKLGQNLFTFVLESTVCLMAVATTLLQEGKLSLPRLEQGNLLWKFLLLGILGALASLFMNMAFSTGFVSVASAISSASPLISIIIGLWFFQEKLTQQQLVAVMMIVIGIVLLPLIA